MSELVHCLSKNVHTEDGTKLGGHVYEPSVSVFDPETDRVYFIDHCIKCGHKSVSFVKRESELYETLVADYTERLIVK